MNRIVMFVCVCVLLPTILGCSSGEKVVTKEETFPNGQVRSRVQYHIKDGEEVLWGEATFYHQNGVVEMKYENANGKRHGKFETYYEGGEPKESGNFAYGNRDGEWVEWDKEGNEKKTKYVAGKLQKG